MKLRGIINIILQDKYHTKFSHHKNAVQYSVHDTCHPVLFYEYKNCDCLLLHVVSVLFPPCIDMHNVLKQVHFSGRSFTTTCFNKTQSMIISYCQNLTVRSYHALCLIKKCCNETCTMVLQNCNSFGILNNYYIIVINIEMK